MLLFELLTLLVVIYFDCVFCNWEDEFKHTSYLDGNQDNFRLYWNTLNATHIDIGLEVKSTGWIALGISENKQMINSDIMMGWIDINDNNTIYLQNRYTESTRVMPEIMLDNNGNEDTSNFELISGEQIDGITRIRYIRLINGCHKYSKSIPMGTARLIWAFNNNLPTNNEIPEYHGSLNRGSQSINLLLGESTQIDLGLNISTFDVIMNNFSLPNDKDTHYVCKLVELPHLNTMNHIVKFEPIITNGNEATVHHIDLYHCPSENIVPDSPSIGFQEICDEWPNMPAVKNISDCASRMVMAWSIGQKSFFFPPNVGMEISGNDIDPLQYVTMQIHYDNPKLIPNITDSSGLRIYYTPILRNESAAILTIAANDLFIPQGISSVLINGYCFDSCLYNQFNHNTYFKAFANSLHSHLLGYSMKLRHIRNGKELKPIDINNNYDFNYQQMVPLINTVDIYGSDTLIVECGFNSSNRSFTTFGGESTKDEMCIAFLMYYPKHNITRCGSTFVQSNWDDFFTQSIQLGYYNDTTKNYNISVNNFQGLKFYESFIYDTEYRERVCSHLSKHIEPEMERVIEFDVFKDDSINYCSTGKQTKDNFVWYIIFGSIGGVIVIVLLIGLLYYCKTKRKTKDYKEMADQQGYGTTTKYNI